LAILEKVLFFLLLSDKLKKLPLSFKDGADSVITGEDCDSSASSVVANGLDAFGCTILVFLIDV